MGEQRRYRRPRQHKRRPPQPVSPSENEIREQPSPIPDLQATAKPSGRQPKRKIKPRGRALNLAKKYARRGLKQAEHGLFQARLALTRARRRADRRKREKQAEREEQLGGFSVGRRRKQRAFRVTARQAAMTVFACVALWSAYQLAGFGGRYMQTRRLEARLSALHSAEVQAEDAQTAEPAQTPEPTPVETENPTQAPAAEPTAAPAKDAVKSTVYHAMGGKPLAQMETLHAQNHDLVAWISIDNVLDLPVVYRNNSYYLTHDFNKNKSTAGTIFLDENHPMTERTQNLLLHGHNMKDGTMFGRLAQYEKNLEYLKAHAFIDFSTLWHQERYVVFAVLDVSLDIGDDRFVEYFAHPTFKSDEEFERYIRRVELASLYAIPMDVKPTDALLTLSTCLDEDRLVILARRQREGEKTASLREIVNMAVRQ